MILALTDAQFNTLITQLPTLFAALGALILGIINAIKGNQRGEESKKAIAEVHTAVNGKSSAAENKIDALRTQVEALTAVAAQSRETAALLAQAARQVVPSEVVVVNESTDPIPTNVIKKP